MRLAFVSLVLLSVQEIVPGRLPLTALVAETSLSSTLTAQDGVWLPAMKSQTNVRCILTQVERVCRVMHDAQDKVGVVVQLLEIAMGVQSTQAR